jgi:hypothetical protein
MMTVKYKAFHAEETEVCPNCGSDCWRESCNVGVGMIYGPWGCECGWSEDPGYNQLTGPKRSELGGVIDQYGGLTPTFN